MKQNTSVSLKAADRVEVTTLIDNYVDLLLPSTVERTTSFEKGMPNALMEEDGELVFDPILDDQAIVMRLMGKGMVVISGCAHSGIVNTMMYAKKPLESKRSMRFWEDFTCPARFSRKSMIRPSRH